MNLTNSSSLTNTYISLKTCLLHTTPIPRCRSSTPLLHASWLTFSRPPIQNNIWFLSKKTKKTSSLLFRHNHGPTVYESCVLLLNNQLRLPYLPFPKEAFKVIWLNWVWVSYYLRDTNCLKGVYVAYPNQTLSLKGHIQLDLLFTNNNISSQLNTYVDSVVTQKSSPCKVCVEVEVNCTGMLLLMHEY